MDVRRSQPARSRCDRCHRERSAAARSKAHTSSISSGHYKAELGALLQLRKNSVYDQINKQTRSSMYKLMDRIDDIQEWYITLEANDQLRWKHPDSIVKHCPQ